MANALTQPASYQRTALQPGSQPVLAGSQYPNLHNQYLKPPQSQQRSNSQTRVIASIAILIILIGGGLIAYLGVVRPNIEHAQATATSQTATSVANAHATSTVLVRVHATATMQAIAQDPQALYRYVTSRPPTVSDSLNNNSSSDWDEGSNPDGSACTFKSGGYHVISSRNQGSWLCLAKADTYSDFALQVQMSIIKGQAGGIVFHFDTFNQKAYFFIVAANGTYTLASFDGNTNKTLAQGSSELIATGLNQQNTLAVIAHRNTINIYINKQFLSSIQDNTSTGGQVALLGVSVRGVLVI